MHFVQFLAVLAIAKPAFAALIYKGVDWSSVPVEEAAGYSYKSAAGVAQSFETTLVASGVNTVRQRLWVTPSGGTYNLDYNIKLAKRAKAAGLKIYLDMHFSDTWADPANQKLPSGWPTAIDDLADKLYQYTLSVSNSFATDGLSPAIISIGNEITTGMLFPTGSTSNYYNLARLLHSASSGIRDSSLGTAPKIAIHLDNGWKWATQTNWWTNVLKQGPLVAADYDIMAVSYYPFFNSAATLAALKTSLANMASTWGKEIMVAETNWPSSCPSPKYAFPSDTTSIGFSAAGQTTWMQKVAAIVAGTKNGVGLFYWEPAWIQNAGLGSSCEWNLMVQNDGVAMASLASFKTI